MSSVDATVESIKEALAPYVRTREEAAHIRRVLALHLESCLKDGAPIKPLALVDTNGANITPEVRGLQRAYLKALNANVEARAEYEAAVWEHNRPRAASVLSDNPGSDHLGEHLRTIKLQRKLQKLQTVLKYMDLVAQKPAAAPEFLEPGEIFKNSAPLPEVPVEVVTGLTRDPTTPKTDLGALINQLEKQVLRAKLLLRQEEQLLDNIKARSSVRPETVSSSAKLAALSVTRNELIGWIEAELAKAGGGGDEPEDDADLRRRITTDPGHMEEQLMGIREKYASYLAARKSLLQLVAQQPRPVIKPKADEAEQDTTPASASIPVAHLLSPYLERMLAVAQDQKALISQKSHFNIIIAKQLKENCQVLDHIAEESHLLPRHPVPGAARRKLGFGDSLAPQETLDSSSRVKPWAYAADSAKIATLEVVAEKIDEGQVALDGTLKTLEDVDRLLGRHTSQDPVAKGDRTDEDIWLAEETSSGTGAKPRKHVDRGSGQAKGDVWDTLDGSLGLLKPDGPL